MPEHRLLHHVRATSYDSTPIYAPPAAAGSRLPAAASITTTATKPSALPNRPRLVAGDCAVGLPGPPRWIRARGVRMRQINFSFGTSAFHIANAGILLHNNLVGFTRGYFPVPTNTRHPDEGGEPRPPGCPALLGLHWRPGRLLLEAGLREAPPKHPQHLLHLHTLPNSASHEGWGKE